MKKLIFSFALAMSMCSTASAQVFVGGGGLVGYSQDTFRFELTPTVGFCLTDNFALGIKGGIGVIGSELYGTLTPFARYTFWENRRVALDGKLKGEMLFLKNELSAAEVGVSPSVRVKLNSNWEMSADFGLFGAQMLTKGNWEPAIGLQTSGVELGFLYQF